MFLLDNTEKISTTPTIALYLSFSLEPVFPNARGVARFSRCTHTHAHSLCPNTQRDARKLALLLRYCVALGQSVFFLLVLLALSLYRVLCFCFFELPKQTIENFDRCSVVKKKYFAGRSQSRSPFPPANRSSNSSTCSSTSTARLTLHTLGPPTPPRVRVRTRSHEFTVPIGLCLSLSLPRPPQHGLSKPPHSRNPESTRDRNVRDEVLPVANMSSARPTSAAAPSFSLCHTPYS